MQRAPVMVRAGREMVQATDEDGRDVWQFNSKGALGSLKMMGDHLGLFRPSTEPPGGLEGLPADTNLEEASDEQLAAELTRLLTLDAR